MNDVTTNEVIDFLKEHMMMKEEVETIIEEKLQATESRILSSVDRFAKLHETLDQELVMMRSQYNRLEEHLEIVEQKLGIPA